ncbi:MAG: LysR family transcriptional regulator [Hungatella sp.]|nr:LysR family transcriptional regulator [Hungatella sp.]
MELQQIRYMTAIAEEQNITRAANKMFISQSAMSQQLMKVERELGTPLFWREGRKLKLTKAGQIYINAAKAILNVEEAFYEEVRELEESSLHIKIAVCTCVPEAVFDKLLEGVLKKLAGTEPDIFLTCCQSKEEWQQLLYSGKADVVIGPADGQENSMLHVWETTAEEFIFVLPPDRKEEVPTVFSPPGSHRRQREKDAAKKAGVRAEEAGSTEISVPAVICGGQMGAFLHSSEMSRIKAPHRKMPGFTMEFCACSLENGRINHSFYL